MDALLYLVPERQAWPLTHVLRWVSGTERMVRIKPQSEVEID
jgi:hypothetical protein